MRARSIGTGRRGAAGRRMPVNAEPPARRTTGEGEAPTPECRILTQKKADTEELREEVTGVAATEIALTEKKDRKEETMARTMESTEGAAEVTELVAPAIRKARKGRDRAWVDRLQHEWAA